MGASIKYNFGTGQKKGYTYVDNFGAGQENCGCKCTHCTHKFGAIAYNSINKKVHLKNEVTFCVNSRIDAQKSAPRVQV